MNATTNTEEEEKNTNTKKYIYNYKYKLGGQQQQSHCYPLSNSQLPPLVRILNNTSLIALVFYYFTRLLYVSIFQTMSRNVTNTNTMVGCCSRNKIKIQDTEYKIYMLICCCFKEKKDMDFNYKKRS